MGTISGFYYFNQHVIIQCSIAWAVLYLTQNGHNWSWQYMSLISLACAPLSCRIYIVGAKNEVLSEIDDCYITSLDGRERRCGGILSVTTLAARDITVHFLFHFSFLWNIFFCPRKPSDSCGSGLILPYVSCPIKCNSNQSIYFFSIYINFFLVLFSCLSLSRAVFPGLFSLFLYIVRGLKINLRRDGWWEWSNVWTRRLFSNWRIHTLQLSWLSLWQG